VKILHAKDETGKYETDCLFTGLFEIIETGRGLVYKSVGITAWSPLHHKVQVMLISESVV
jgi:hypothetical protein